MNLILAAYLLAVAFVVVVRFGHTKHRLQELLHRAPMTTGSFWFSGSFKLTESIQRQEFAVLAYVLTTTAVISGVFAGVSLALERASTNITVASLGLSLGCFWYSGRSILANSSRRNLKSGLFVVVHSAMSVVAILTLSR